VSGIQDDGTDRAKEAQVGAQNRLLEQIMQKSGSLLIVHHRFPFDGSQ